MTSRRGQELAAKLRAVIEARAAESAARKSEDAARQARLCAARQALMGDLFAFGESVGHLVVSQSKKRVVFGFEGGSLRFEVTGSADRVTVGGGSVPDGTYLGLQAELNRWVVHTPSRGRQEDQTLLFDGGLARLIALGLGLTTPAE